MCSVALLTAAPGGCAPILVMGIPLVIYTEVLPRIINGKGLAEDGVDLVTGWDCRVIEGVIRKNRQFCEDRGSPETKKDFKGLLGLVNKRET